MPLLETHDCDCQVEIGSGFCYPEHLHTHYEVVLVLRGWLQIAVAGKPYTLHAGHLAVIFPWQLHSYVAFHPDCHMVLMLFSADITETAAPQGIPCEVLHALTELPQEEQFCLRQLAKPQPPAVQKAYLQLCLTLFWPRLPVSPRRILPREDTLLQALQYLHAHAEQPLTLCGVARAVGITAGHLSHLFSQRLHTGFRGYLTALRLARARQLLREGAQSITQVGYECGFESLRTFERAFLLHCGCTPRRFRQLQRETGND